MTSLTVSSPVPGWMDGIALDMLCFSKEQGIKYMVAFAASHSSLAMEIQAGFLSLLPLLATATPPAQMASPYRHLTLFSFATLL